jgi:magnesium chelatase family protein
MNPCPRGYYGDSVKPGSCAPSTVTKYQKGISNPSLHRIDIHIEVPRVDYEKSSGNKVSESFKSIRQRIQAARNIQQGRFSNPDSRISNIVCNADMRVGQVRQFCKLDDQNQDLILSAMTQLNLSARAYHP